MKLEDKVLERIDALGGKIDNISQHAWESLVKYQIIHGVINVIIGIVIIALTIFLWKVFINQYKKVNSEDYARSLLFEDDEDLSIIGIVYLLLVFLLTIIAFVYLVTGAPTDIMRIVNPEVFAVKDLINQAKGVK
uniref:Membrane protein n=1 Tax=Staphylococcus phage UHP46 TaxID=3234966 RepID=A0AB39C8C4_9CAUD